MTENQIQFVTLEVVKEHKKEPSILHCSCSLLISEVRLDLLEKNFDELRRSLEFSESQLKDTRDKVMNLDRKVESAKLSVKDRG